MSPNVVVVSTVCGKVRGGRTAAISAAQRVEQLQDGRAAAPVPRDAGNGRDTARRWLLGGDL